MSRKHLKRIAAPKIWSVSRKQGFWITRPSPGPHKIDNCLTLDYVVRDVFKLANNLLESKKSIKTGKILVDQKVRLNHKFPVGVMDSISLADQKKHYRVVLNPKKMFKLVEIPEKEAKLKLCKVTGKKILKKDKIQLNLHDGKNLLTDDKKIKPGDSILLDLAAKKIKEHFKLEEGVTVYLIGGKHPGVVGFLEGFKSTGKLTDPKVVVKSGEEVFETSKKYLFVVGKSSPAIIIQKKK